MGVPLLEAGPDRETREELEALANVFVTTVLRKEVAR